MVGAGLREMAALLQWERKSGSSFRWDKKKLPAFTGCESVGSEALLVLCWQLEKLGHAVPLAMALPT